MSQPPFTPKRAQDDFAGPRLGFEAVFDGILDDEAGGSEFGTRASFAASSTSCLMARRSPKRARWMSR
jgi:hypothetical protein